tara:strand:+ start:894 stop:2390 length:1497 start_codon:yes stop_codon:yes gene_type:complete
MSPKGSNLARHRSVMEKKFWKSLLLTGIAMHFLAAFLMPLGLDAHVHASYVSDGMDDGEAHLEWGELRADSQEGSTTNDVPADGKWFAWHLILELWFTVFSISATTLHILGLVGGLGCLAAIYLLTRELFSEDYALQLTALASIYPPLIRATGRVYQEGFVLMLVAISTYAIIKALRDDKKFSMWWLVPFSAALVILSFKGMPMWYVLPAAFALFISTKLEMNQIQFTLVALIVQLFVITRNEISMTNVDIIPALLTAFIAYFLYVRCGMLLICDTGAATTTESEYLTKGSKMISASLVGWIAALWVTEAVTFGTDFFDIIRSFRHNGRYLSLLIVPMWYGVMARKENKGLNFEENKKRVVLVLVGLLMAVNASLIVLAEERGTDVIGEYLEDEISDDEDVLFIANSPLSMHRLYSIKFSMDPNSDKESMGFWRTNTSDWQVELTDCDTLKNVNWIINYPYTNLTAPEGWVEVKFEGSDRVSDNYHLYTWGGENERCP